MLAKTAPFLRRVAQAIFTQEGKACPFVGKRDEMVFIIFKKKAISYLKAYKHKTMKFSHK